MLHFASQVYTKVKNEIMFFNRSSHKVFFLGGDNVAKSGMSAVQLVLLTIANLANPISINDKTHGIRYKYTHYSFSPLYI